MIRTTRREAALSIQWSEAVARSTRARTLRRVPQRGKGGNRDDAAGTPEPALVSVIGPLRVDPSDQLAKMLDDLLAQVNGWLRFAEGKSAALLGLASGSTLALVATLASRRDGDSFLRGGLALATVLVALSLLVVLVSFLPRLDLARLLGSTRPSADSDINLLFYGHLADYTPRDLATAVALRYCEGAPIRRLHLDLAAQVVINSRITVGKLRLFAWAVRFFGAAFVVLVATAVVSVFT